MNDLKDILKTDKNPFFFYDKNLFPFLEQIENNYETIRDELIQLIASNNEGNWLHTFPNYVKSEKQKAWKVYSFLFFSMKFPSHANLCPKTAELIFSVPEIMSCDYSYLKANTKILPHKGYSRMVLRCHLPLIVPKGNLCGLRVGTETKYWKEGELFIFDDSFEHEAWNDSDEDRVVLMFDIPNPRWGYSAQEISDYKIKNIDDPFLLSFASYEVWQNALKQGVFPIEQFDL
jgi:aspartyl/asparaginyl beta-hydroxylase (cupin superfamily)